MYNCGGYNAVTLRRNGARAHMTKQNGFPRFRSSTPSALYTFRHATGPEADKQHRLPGITKGRRKRMEPQANRGTLVARKALVEGFQHRRVYRREKNT